MKTSIAIVGAAGRMGRRLCDLVRQDSGLELVEAVDRAEHPEQGKPLIESGEVKLAAELGNKAQVVIDFSSPASTRQVIAQCMRTNQALVIGTTGLADADQHAIENAGYEIPILQASNFSLVVNVMHHVSAIAARLLGDAYEMEVLEIHHNQKKDAPSGTALALAQTLCEARGLDAASDIRCDRHGDDVPRRHDEITVQALRVGDHPGEHTVYLAAQGERLEIRHVSTSRDSYAMGALRAAKWLAGRPAGRYHMKDVLEF